MSQTIQDFVAEITQKQSDDLVKAYLNLPEDKRAWAPDEKARTAIDQVAECAMINGFNAALLEERISPTAGDLQAFSGKKAELAGDWNAVKALMDKNTTYLVETIRALPDSDLAVELDLPWGKRTVKDMISICYWNMSYHEGQINYIASIVGSL